MQRILLIEDDFHLLRLCTRLLQHADYQVCPAAAYPAALDMFRLYGTFALCISDINVGFYDPVTLIQELYRLRQRFETPMLVMSADMSKHAQRCEDLQLPWIEKPFSNQEFVERVMQLIVPQDQQKALS